MKIKTSHWIAGIAMIFSSLFFIIILFWWSWPYKTVEYKSPVTVLNKTVKAGQVVQYRIDYCKYVDYSAYVDRAFVDGIIYTVPTVRPNLPTGCHVKIQSVEVPANLPPSEYKLKVYVTFQVNPIRTITKSYETNIFNVIE